MSMDYFYCSMLAWMSRRSSSTDASAVAALVGEDDGEDDAATDENYFAVGLGPPNTVQIGGGLRRLHDEPS